MEAGTGTYMGSFCGQHEQQLHQSSALPYCLLSQPLPVPAGFTALEAAAAMAHESTSGSSMSPLVLQVQKNAAAAAGGGDPWMPAIQGSSSCSLGSTQQMDGSRGKSRKQMRSNVGMKGLEEKGSRVHGDVKAKEAGREPPAAGGYIHVRARRGQATDSHSLAERVRREKISERMKMLQSLVPGCDKIAGKALMLDEIISYVQSLQNQVEFLSMKLASLSPMMYEFGLGMDMHADVPQLVKMPHEHLRCVGQGDQLGSSGAPGISLQGPTALAQDGSSSHMNSNVMQVPEQGQQVPLQHQVDMSGLCFFQ